MWQSKGSLCDRLGAYCRATWLLTLWQGKQKKPCSLCDKGGKKTEHSLSDNPLQPSCDNLKTDCATREVQTAEHTEIFLRMKMYAWIGRYTNELGFRFLEGEDIRMNWKTYEWIGVAGRLAGRDCLSLCDNAWQAESSLCDNLRTDYMTS